MQPAGPAVNCIVETHSWSAAYAGGIEAGSIPATHAADRRHRCSITRLHRRGGTRQHRLLRGDAHCTLAEATQSSNQGARASHKGLRPPADPARSRAQTQKRRRVDINTCLAQTGGARSCCAAGRDLEKQAALLFLVGGRRHAHAHTSAAGGRGGETWRMAAPRGRQGWVGLCSGDGSNFIAAPDTERYSAVQT